MSGQTRLFDDPPRRPAKTRQRPAKPRRPRLLLPPMPHFTLPGEAVEGEWRGPVPGRRDRYGRDLGLLLVAGESFTVRMGASLRWGFGGIPKGVPVRVTFVESAISQTGHPYSTYRVERLLRVGD